MTYPAAAHAVNTAIYARLSGDATLLATATGGVHDDVPDGTAYPYVVMGESSEAPFDSFTQQGRSVIVTIHTWSQYQGAKETETMLSRIITLLDRYALSVSGGVLTRCVFESKQTMRDPDGLTRHGVVTFLVQVGES